MASDRDNIADETEEEVMSCAKSETQGKASEFFRTLRAHLPGLKERYKLNSLGVLGSYMRGEEREDSDLDILVEFACVPSLFEFLALKLELSNLLGVNVDLVMKRALKPRIGERILQEVVQV